MFSSRHRRIEFFFARAILTIAFWDLLLPRIGLRSVARRTRSNRLRRIAARYRNLANELGGLLIKVGQFLSSRVDVMPAEITSELGQLQDEVRAETFEAIRARAEQELGGSLDSIFAEFDSTPLAAASLGQVHRAKLREPSNGVTNIVVKVQRPRIDEIVAIDFAALRTVIGWLVHYRPIRKRVNLFALLAEFTKILDGELNYIAEGKNAETFAENFHDDADIRVPRVIWSHTTQRVLALEDVYGIKITDYDGITAAGIDRALVADKLFHTYLQQIFHDGFFHADPHPGNLFVKPSPLIKKGRNEGGWQLAFVDFGMVGRVTPEMRAGLRELAIGIGTRDSARLIKGYQTLDVLLPDADIAQIQKMESKVLERFWGKTMSELRALGYQEMRQFANEFREVIASAPFQVPENLVLLARCVAILSGMCTGLNPQFNVWVGLEPFAAELLTEDGAFDWKFWAEEIAAFGLAMARTPTRMYRVLGKMEKGELAVKTPQLVEQVSRLELTVRRLTGAIIFAGLVFSGTQIYLAGEKNIAYGIFAAGVVAIVWVVTMRK